MGYPHITDLNLSQYSPTLIPKKPQNFACCTSITTSTSTSTTALSSPCNGCPNPTNINLALSHGEQHQPSKTPAEVLSSEQQHQPLGSSRWNPTPEQLLALEELYRRGTRTPSAPQIQQIAIGLRRFGKIEGKNVFYWFQNHKARERQKRRRESESSIHEQPQIQKQLQPDTHESLEYKESGTVSETAGSKIEQTKNKGPPPSTISKVSEECISNSKHEVAAAAAAAAADVTVKSGPNEWMKIQEKDLQQIRKITVGKWSVSTWEAMELSSSAMYSRVLNTENLCSLKPHQEKITNLEDENRENQTLELFPLGSNNGICNMNGINNISKKDTQVPIRAINTTTTFTTTPNQYFEFLPLKN